jgi:hypothetical protein
LPSVRHETLGAIGRASKATSPWRCSGRVSATLGTHMSITLGPRQLAIVVVSLAEIGSLVVLVNPYEVDAWYWREVVGPALRKDLGFETGRVDVNFGSERMRMFAVTAFILGVRLIARISMPVMSFFLATGTEIRNSITRSRAPAVRLRH